MRIETDLGTVELIDEPMYSFDSSDNARAYRFARNFAINGKATSAHGVLLNSQAIAVFGKNGGCTGVHAHSVVYERGLMYLAVGDSAVCVRLNPFEFKWIAQVDSATCFGIHRHAGHQALISHGELEIARLSKDGDLLWSSSGADIFSEGFSLLPHCIEVVDFNGIVYRFDYENGRSVA